MCKEIYDKIQPCCEKLLCCKKQKYTNENERLFWQQLQQIVQQPPEEVGIVTKQPKQTQSYGSTAQL
jgi:hypothetical protein